MSDAWRRSLRSLEVPNYRLWFTGQLLSVSGNWMQIVAEMWLVLTITGSAFALGATAALQFLPMLLVGLWGGLLADRVSKRQLLIVTQALMAIPAFALFALTVSGGVAAWMVMALVFLRGTVMAVDSPARQSFVIEIVGPDRVVNAVGLQSVLIHSSRIAGPALAGLLIALGGIAFCFLVNGLSFVAMLVALMRLDGAALRPPRTAVREPRAVRTALRYVAGNPTLAIPMAMMALIGTLGFNFQVLLPLLARDTFAGDATAYSALAVAMGAGAVGGALFTSAREHVGDRLLVGAAAAFGAIALASAAAPTLAVAALALVPLGFASVAFAAGVNSTLQLEADPQMRGRVMALYMIVFMGTTPIGGPLVGALSGATGPRAGLVLAGVAGLAAALAARVAFNRAQRARSAVVHPTRTSLPAPYRAQRATFTGLGPEEAVGASPGERDSGRARECEPVAAVRTQRTPRRRSALRRGPRSPGSRPRDDATRAR